MVPNQIESKNSLSSPHPLHRKQTLQQILLPLILFSVMFLAMAVLAAITTSNYPSVGSSLSSIAIIFMLIPIMLIGLLGVLILLLLIIGANKLTSVLPNYTLLGKIYVSFIARKVKLWSDLVTSPVVKIRGWSAGWRAFLAHFHLA
jgi:hypothetical protein